MSAPVVLDPGTVRSVLYDEMHGTSPRHAAEIGITPTVVFVRRDGWTLGAPAVLERAAHRLWRERWVSFARLEDGWRIRPITEYEGNV